LFSYFSRGLTFAQQTKARSSWLELGGHHWETSGCDCRISDLSTIGAMRRCCLNGMPSCYGNDVGMFFIEAVGKPRLDLLIAK